MAYRVIPVLLTNAATRREIVGPGNPIAAVTVLTVPAGAAFSLHLGQGDAIPFDSPSPLLGITDPQDYNNGLFLSNVAQVGVTVNLLVSFKPSAEMARQAGADATVATGGPFGVPS